MIQGPQNPSTATPRRRPNSIRRTTTIEMSFPTGLAGDIVHRGLGRDLLTHADGRAEVLDEAAFDASIAFSQGQRLTGLTTSPPIEGVEILLGTAAGGGYRKYLMQIARTSGIESLQFLLLDDLAGASLVSGYAPQLAIAGGGEEAAAGEAALAPEAEAIMKSMTDLCAGWQEGGTILQSVYKIGHPPMMQGAVAPQLDPQGDPLAWHQVDTEMMPHGMRRIRRIDVTRGEDANAPLIIEAMFRDTHMDEAGLITIVHEYEMAAAIEPATLRILSIEASPRVLPFRECPQAAASALRVAGTTTNDLRARTRAEFQGASTCTHLNDVLRSLEDVGALAAKLDREYA